MDAVSEARRIHEAIFGADKDAPPAPAPPALPKASSLPINMGMNRKQRRAWAAQIRRAMKKGAKT
jgi:hypothetical protein